MTAQPLHIRQLAPDEIQNLSSLFQAERKEENKLDFWQERGDRFLKIYDHHIQGPAVFWGAFANNELLGVTGVVPTLANNPFTNNHCSLHTDFFVSPEHRSRAASVKLILAFKDWVIEQGIHAPYFFGVEHNWMGLEACNLIAQKHGCRFNFPLQSMLTQIFLTHQPTFSTLSSVQCARLCDLPASFLSQWKELYSRSRQNCFYAPILQEDTFKKIQTLDPECEFIWTESQGEITAGTLLLNPARARQFLWSGKPNLVIARLQKTFREQFRPGSEIRMGLISLSLGSGALLRQVFESAVSRAWDRKFHALAFRDEEQNLLTSLTLDQFQFPRRVLVAHGPDFPAASELEKQLRAGMLKPRLETTFL